MSEPRILHEVMIDGKKYIEAAGVTGQEKPAGDFVTGSSYLELDPENNNVKVYFYNEEDSDWMALGGDE